MFFLFNPANYSLIYVLLTVKIAFQNCSVFIKLFVSLLVFCSQVDEDGSRGDKDDDTSNDFDVLVSDGVKHSSTTTRPTGSAELHRISSAANATATLPSQISREKPSNTLKRHDS